MTAPIEDIRVHAFRIPTDQEESDGTLVWDSTTLVLVELTAGGRTGIGYTYSDASAAAIVAKRLAPLVRGLDAAGIGRAWTAMLSATRNMGTRAVSAAAISAVDNALWDLKARLLEVPLVELFPVVHESVPVYGSGGFTSYSDDQLAKQFSGWVESGIRMVKMKVGREPDRDVQRVKAARKVIGDDVALFVDANGAFTWKRALWFAEAFADVGVTWFEEPVPSDDLTGLRLLCEHGPAGMEIAAGEYGWDVTHFQRLLDARAVDVLQADATRCCGMTGFLVAGALSTARLVDLSAHTAANLHAHVCPAVPRMRHIEYFHDHARIEEMLFDGALVPTGGALRPDRSRHGMGLAFKWQDAEPYRLAVP